MPFQYFLHGGEAVGEEVLGVEDRDVAAVGQRAAIIITTTMMWKGGGGEGKEERERM